MAAWTPEEDAAIRARAKTHSAAQIAALLPGRTRASVTGRAWRLGESLAKDETTRRALEHPHRQRTMRSRPPPPPPADPEAWPAASPAARRAALAVRPRLLRLVELGAGDCRWPYGDADLRFCGHVHSGAGPYCPAHRALAYVAGDCSYDVEALAVEIDRREARLLAAAGKRNAI